MILPQSRPVGTREVKARFRVLLDQVAGGEHFVVYRGSKPLAAMIPIEDLDRLRELLDRDEALAVVLQAKNCIVEPWATAGIIQAILSLSIGPAGDERNSPDGSHVPGNFTGQNPSR